MAAHSKVGEEHGLRGMDAFWNRQDRTSGWAGYKG